MLNTIRLFNLSRTLFSFSRAKLNTEVFSDLTYNQISTPQLTKAIIRKAIHNHSRVSQSSLFHKKRVSGQIRTCFSEKKHKVFRRVNKFRKYFYSDVLQRKVHATVSSKAYRCIQKMGSFDNYILCTKPKDLDSKFGEYLRELMLRKVNNPEFRVPYVIGSNRKLRVKKYDRHVFLKEMKKIKIPKFYRENFKTYQKKFGNTPKELNNQDYKKYLELQELKRTLGDQLEPTHPLLLELKEKMKGDMTDEEISKVNQMAAQAEQDYLNEKNHKDYKRRRVQKAKKEIQAMEMKLHEISFQFKSQELDE